MTTLVILIVFTATLAILDYPWISIALIVPAALLFSRASSAFQVWVENRSGRRPDGESERYAAAYYFIGLGVLTATIFYYPSLNPLAFAAIAGVTLTVASGIATALFGRRDLQQ